MFSAEQMSLIKRVLTVCSKMADADDKSELDPGFKLKLKETMKNFKKNQLRLSDIPNLYVCFASVKDQDYLMNALNPEEKQTFQELYDRLHTLCH